MLNVYIEDLRELYERLSAQNTNLFRDVVTAWELTAQIMAKIILPIIGTLGFITIYFITYKKIVNKIVDKNGPYCEVAVFKAALAYSAFTWFIMAPFIYPVILYLFS